MSVICFVLLHEVDRNSGKKNCTLFSSVDNRSMAPGPPPYPTLPSSMTNSTDSLRHPPQLPVKYVKVLHSYDAEHDDELTIRPGKDQLAFF